MGRLPALFVALTCLGQQPISAQASTGLAVTPSAGVEMVVHDRRLESGGLSALLQVAFRGPRVEWGLFASARGLGGGCSDGCDFSGQAFGAEAAFRMGRVAVGGGFGLIHRFAGWYTQPHGALSLAMGTLQLQLRLEVSGGNRRVHIPLLLGRPVPVG